MPGRFRAAARGSRSASRSAGLPTGCGSLRGRAALALLGGLLLAGCENLWEWTAPTGSYEALLAEGRAALREGDTARALERLAAAVELRPEGGEARYYYAKAAVLDGGIDVIDLVQTITDTTRGAAEVFASDTPLADRIYRVNGLVVDALLPIREGTADPEGLGTSDVNADLAVAYTLRGILRLRDTNGDGRIDENDLPVDLFGLNDDGGYSLDGLDNIPPGDLNDMIDDLNDLLASGGDLVSDLGGGGIDPDDLNDLIDSLGGDLSAFYVNTGVPGNPGEGDNDHDGLVDEECLNELDDDGDGLVDEDARVLGCP